MPVPEVLVVAPPRIRTPEGGMIAAKFTAAEQRCIGLAEAYERVTAEENCRFFDAAKVTTSSRIDGVHLDAVQHERLGHALAAAVTPLL